MSKSYSNACEKAMEWHMNLRADNPAFSGTVIIIHEEGTVLVFRYADVREWEGWYLITTEHHGPHVYSVDDVSAHRLAEQPIPQLSPAPDPSPG